MKDAKDVLVVLDTYRVIGRDLKMAQQVIDGVKADIKNYKFQWDGSKPY